MLLPEKLTMDALGRKSLAHFRQAEKNPCIVILDNVRSMENVGSIFRTADAFLIERIFLCGITPTPPHRAIQKTALGATDSVVWEYYSDALSLIPILRKEGYVLSALEQTNTSMALHNFTFRKDKKYAFFFGNELSGVSDSLLPLMDYILEIPQYGTKHSLNISVSVGITLWNFLRMRV